MSGPRVSVIMPFVNAAAWISEAVESVLAQSCASWELLLVDDGAADGSAGIARAYAARDQRIRVLSTRHGSGNGASAARNTGIALARGDFLALLDADDVWLPHKLETQLSLLDDRPDVGSLCADTLLWFSWTGRAEDLWRDTLFRIGVDAGTVLQPPDFLALALRQDAQLPCTCSMLIRRNIVERIGGFVAEFRRVFTDQAFYTRLFLAAPVLVAGGCTDFYRQHPASSVRSASKSGELARTRLAYLDWAADHLDRNGAGGTEPRRLIEEQRWRLQHPVATRLFQLSGAASRSWRAMCAASATLLRDPALRAVRKQRHVARATGAAERAMLTFLQRHRAAVKGRVVALSASELVWELGGARVGRVDLLTSAGSDRAGEDLPHSAFDCALLRLDKIQVFRWQLFIRAAARLVRRRGVLLLVARIAESVVEDGLLERWLAETFREAMVVERGSAHVCACGVRPIAAPADAIAA